MYKRQVYKITNVGMVIGGHVTSGKIVRGAQVRLVRDGIIVADDKIASLRRFKDDVKEVQDGYDCGITLERFSDIKLGDIIEGYTMEDAAYAVRVIRLLGAKTMIVTNAAGAVNTDYQAGDLMLISDHIKLFDFGPLWGPNIEEFGTRFPDMSNVYSPRLRALAKEVAREQELTLREGVYMYFPGPQFETPAEVRAARILGADAVGMSTAPEAIAAAHCGYEILGVTLCANMAAGVLPQPLSGEEVNEMAEQSAPHFSSLILGCLERL